MFRYASSGAFLKLLSPGTDELVTMDGKATGMFFGDYSAELLISMLQKNGNNNLLQELDGKNLIMHPASRPVVNRIGRLLSRNKYISGHTLPFLMDEARQSNGSSATTFNRLRYMIEHDLIDPKKQMVWIAPGLGSVIAGAIGSVNL